MTKENKTEVLLGNLKHLLREFSELHGITYNTMYTAVKETIEKVIEENKK